MYSDFDSIIKKLSKGRTWDFPGGVKPDSRKSISNESAISRLPMPGKLFVTVKQHVGVEGHIEVSEGEHVLKGQALTRSMNPFAVPVHAPTSGTVKGIKEHVSAHPSGLPELTIEIVPDKEDQWVSLTPLPHYQELPKIKTVEAICNAGISGMGGAGFPTHIKASPKKDIEFLIINGVECEPYITSDDRLMREHAWQIRQGIDVLTHLLSPKQVLIAVEDNKPEAIKAMQVACQENPRLMVCAVPTKYPAGGEKQLIQVLTNREVPQQGLPADVGVIMQNVGTCFAIADAIYSGKPLIERVVTLTGEALNQRGNVWALIGTPIAHLLRHAEYQAKRQKKPKAIMGGPMMGFTIASDQVPVIKTTNCILVPEDHEIADVDNEQPCIRCGECADACPASLLPQQLYWHSKAKELDKAQEYHLFDCIECGACAFVCPSEIPLVHYYRVAKADVRTQEIEKDKADKARERFEARQERLQREQQEREERHRKAAEARKAKMEATGGDAQDKIAAALARAKAKKQGSADQDSSSAKQPSNVAAAIARAKAKKAAAQDQSNPNEAQSSESEKLSAGQQVSTAPTDNKSDRVAAAIARAKAKKAAAQEQAQSKAPQSSESEEASANLQESTAPTENKSDRVAAAIARAKAKKAAAQSQMREDAPQSEAAQQARTDIPDSSSKEEEKAARVAAAVARAKARKASREQTESADTSNSEPSQAISEQSASLSENQGKEQEKIVRAIARAKARREQARTAHLQEGE